MEIDLDHLLDQDLTPEYHITPKRLSDGAFVYLREEHIDNELLSDNIGQNDVRSCVNENIKKGRYRNILPDSRPMLGPLDTRFITTIGDDLKVLRTAVMTLSCDEFCVQFAIIVSGKTRTTWYTDKRTQVNDLVTKLDTLHENNPKLFWETIDKLKNKTVKTNPISISDWHKYMNDLYAADKHENPNFIPTAPDFSDTGPLDFPFTCGEVRKGIHKLKNNKQPGIDMIPNEFIKYGKNKLLPSFVNLFNRILSSGVFPDCWNISCTTFIHKNGDINCCDNYRCLGLTSCFGKLFTSLLQTRLNGYLDDHNLY
ncbi:unnamed protein product [Mytilus edulis]|uniref:Reverse transcriptase domain-containing protein n=1 Tax=Mytilus edulis TaxID=6550 RepID=A0A8S3RVF0_MYTED|nr:unnamed protein product [Mytilus edulis]